MAEACAMQWAGPVAAEREAFDHIRGQG
jgi:hypothetical protein